MKKYTALLIALALFISFTSQATQVSEKCHGWYFKKTQDHTQPALDSELSFIDKYSGYYIDRNHCDYSDKDKVIYLTFDVGYENGNVEKILDIMKEEEVTGAFFILENVINRNPELVKRMNDEGHLICNHTAKHPNMTKYTSIDEFRQELDRLNTVCKEKLNIEVAPFFRPPEGKFNETTLQFASELGYSTIFWSFAYADWDNDNQLSPEKALEKLKAGVHNGEILLLHPTSSTNAAILKDFISYMKECGFRFASLNELTDGR